MHAFFLTEKQKEKIKNYSIDLTATAMLLFKTRGDFTFEELLNISFLGALNGGGIPS